MFVMLTVQVLGKRTPSLGSRLLHKGGGSLVPRLEDKKLTLALSYTFLGEEIQVLLVYL